MDSKHWSLVGRLVVGLLILAVVLALPALLAVLPGVEGP